MTRRYRELLEHYGLRGSKNTPGRAHENGDVESSHRGFKNALDQRLRLRGSRDFESVESYWQFVEALVNERNGARTGRVAEERAVLRELPVRALPAYREEHVAVKRWGVIRVSGKVYSLPSRLIGHRVPVPDVPFAVVCAWSRFASPRAPSIGSTSPTSTPIRSMPSALLRPPRLAGRSN